MKPNKLPPEILKLLPQPGPGYLTPEFLQRLSPEDAREVLRRVPRESFEVMVETVAGWSDQMASKMTPEAWQRRLQASIRPAVLAGTLSAMQVIAAAERSRAIDVALRDMLAEGLDLPGDVAATTALRAYMQKALRRDITVDPQGPHPEDNYPRDLGITILMTLTMVRWPYLRKSVSRASKRPSASMVVAAALSRRRIASLTHHAVVKVFDNHDLIVARMMGWAEGLIST